MMGLLLVDSGKVTLLGENTENLSKKAKKKIGYMLPSDRTLYYKLTASENLMMIGSIYGMHKKELKEMIPQLLENVGLKEEGKYIETFSTGMKKRLMLARAILYDPEILFLDEPYSGLDEDGCYMLTEVIQEQSDSGKTIILVTHQDDYVNKSWQHLVLKDGHLCTGL